MSPTNSIHKIVQDLAKKYPDARYELNWDNPLQLLLGTILAAQCPDERVNQVTPNLFARFPSASAYAKASVEEIQEYIQKISFCHKKAVRLKEVCQQLVDRYKGEVPANMEDLVSLPGIARKTANVVLNQAFKIPSGVIVDSHVARVSQRLGLTRQTKPERIETELMEKIPKKDWIQFGAALVLHGRYICTANDPQCPDCMLKSVCPRQGVESSSQS